MRRGGGWALLLRHLARQWRALLRVVGWSLVEALPALTSGLYVAAALDEGFLAGRPMVGLSWLGVLGIARVVGTFATRRLFPWLAEVVEPVRDALARDVAVAALVRGTAPQGAPDGTEVARLAQQVESVRGLLSALIQTFRQVGFAVVASLVGITALAPSVALLVAPPLALALVLYVSLLRPLSQRQRSLVLETEAIARSAGEVLGGLRDVVACGAGQRAAAVVGAPIDQQALASRRMAHADTIRTLVVTLGADLPVIGILIASPWLLRRQQLSIGELSGAIVYLTSSLAPALDSLVDVTGSWGLQLRVVLANLAAACRVPPAPPAGLGLVPAGLDLELDGVTFAYGAHAEPVVRDLTLGLTHGTHLAIVGPSGVGKSTLANLLAGLVPPDRGEVRLGGVPLVDVSGPHLRRVVALIPQEAYVFAGTLRDNLTYLWPHAGDDELDRAAELVGLRPVVERLGGYGALLGPDGAELSTGERQLVALTRVYVSRAAIVLLDEATCHLDPVAEARAEQAFASRGGTLIVIAHRISSALRAERILLMNGATPLLGTHASLLATSPIYADLVGHWQPEMSPPRRPVAQRAL